MIIITSVVWTRATMFTNTASSMLFLSTTILSTMAMYILSLYMMTLPILPLFLLIMPTCSHI
uniref:NADH dehydrogenase subunit 2 n=1 Tax=Meloidogyne incognita TaxID=6306 RepID=A0A914M3F9_MELIC